jgi:hypothetical protein
MSAKIIMGNEKEEEMDLFYFKRSKINLCVHCMPPGIADGWHALIYRANSSRLWRPAE